MVRNAAIIGAGIGGLTAAHALGQAGWQVRLFEQAPQLGEVGAGIQISPNAGQVLDKLGLLDALAAKASEPKNVRIIDGGDGSAILKMPLGNARQRWGQPYLLVHRADLLDVLAEGLEDILELGQAKDAGELAQRFDLVVACDGVKSQTRVKLFGDPQPRFSGHNAWRFLVPTSSLDLPKHLFDDSVVWAGKGCHAVTYALRGGSLLNVVAITEQSEELAEGWRQEGQRELLAKQFATMGPMFQQLVKAAPQPLYQWGLYTRLPLPRWHRNNVVLLGDAAHAMLPSQAQGAAQAIEDAWVLAKSLEGQGLGKGQDLSEGLKTYYRLRQPRTTRIAARSARNVGVFHQDQALGRLRHYTPMRLASAVAPWAIQASFDWIYGHDVTRAKSA